MLERSIKRGVINHAYIFSGPESVGKFTLAKMFALSLIASADLNLEIKDFNKDALLDLIVLEPEIVEKNNISKQRDIPIETVREAKQKLSLFPYHGKYKILIVRDAHRMNSAAQNGLLKILEEPNPTTILILVTHEIDRILPTIISRCQMVNFGLADEKEMMAEPTFRQTTEFSIGRPGFAQNMYEKVDERELKLEARIQLSKILSGSLNERFSLADEFSKDIVDTLQKLNAWTWELRKKALAADCQEAERAQIFVKIEKIQKSMQVLKRTNANSKLILETLFMDL